MSSLRGSLHPDPLDLVVQQAQGLITLAGQLKTQASRLYHVETTVGKLITAQEAAQQDLLHVERAPEKPAPRTTRSKIVELVRAYVYATGANYQMTWNKLYRELQYRYHFDAKARANHRQAFVLDVVEQAGHVETLFRITSDLLPLPLSPNPTLNAPVSH